MTNPDNVGGLPELPATIWLDSLAGRLYTADQMRAYGELCRAAPAGGVAYHALNRILAVIGADGEIDSRHAAVVDAMEALRGIDGGRYQEDAPAGSGEVMDSWQKWPIINRLQMQANDCEDAADMESDAVIMPLQLKALATDLREAAALLRKLQQGEDYVMVPRVASEKMHNAGAAIRGETEWEWNGEDEYAVEGRPDPSEIWTAMIAASQDQDGV